MITADVHSTFEMPLWILYLEPIAILLNITMMAFKDKSFETDSDSWEQSEREYWCKSVFGTSSCSQNISSDFFFFFFLLLVKKEGRKLPTR